MPQVVLVSSLKEIEAAALLLPHREQEILATNIMESVEFEMPAMATRGEIEAVVMQLSDENRLKVARSIWKSLEPNANHRHRLADIEAATLRLEEEERMSLAENVMESVQPRAKELGHLKNIHACALQLSAMERLMLSKRLMENQERSADYDKVGFLSIVTYKEIAVATQRVLGGIDRLVAPYCSRPLDIAESWFRFIEWVLAMGAVMFVARLTGAAVYEIAALLSGGFFTIGCTAFCASRSLPAVKKGLTLVKRKVETSPLDVTTPLWFYSKVLLPHFCLLLFTMGAGLFISFEVYKIAERLAEALVLGR